MLLTDELKWTEWAFGVSMNAWVHIEKMVNEYGFVNRREEISFYKIVKPKFIAMIDYFSLVYKSIVLQPDNSLRRAFWQLELKNCDTLLSIYKTACLQYEQQEAVEKYFLKKNNQQPVIFGLNVSRFNFSAVSYSYLLGRINAVENYRKYLRLKVHKAAAT